MSPRTPIGDTAMSSAERIQRSRWINKIEETAIRMLDLLNEAPESLSRLPDIPAELVQKLIPYINTGSQPVQTRKQQPEQRFLKLGNGNQVSNKKKALKFTAHHLGAKILDKRTVHSEEWGNCHFSAYTHPGGAMISTPGKPDQEYGGADWHSNDHVILFRELEDGRCMIYISKIEPLFPLRTIGHHGVKWPDIEKVADYSEVLETSEVIKEYEALD